MKKIFTLLLLPAFPLLFLSFYFTPEKISLHTALKDGIITARAQSAGGYSGRAVVLKVRNNLKKTENFVIPAGTLFIADEEPQQDLFVAEDQYFTLKPGESGEIGVSAFCCQASDKCPSTGSGFSISTTKNEKLKKLAEGLKKIKYPENCLQDAVWCISDNSPVSDIYCEKPSGASELKGLVCSITGQKESWYQKRHERTVSEDMVITSVPQEVSGNINYKATKGDLIRNELRGPDNEKMFDLGEPMKAAMSGILVYKFKLRIKGFPKGTYKVLIFANDKKLLDQSFVI